MPFKQKQQVNLGFLPNDTYPPNDTKVYIYKRTNGHLYAYSFGSEKHICCDDELITSIPIFNFIVSPTRVPIHRPDANHVMLYIYGGEVYMYDINLTSTLVGGSGGGDIEGLIEW
jgi:hypothetical protein